jgi:acetyl-CoA/propionyl-CoA carboxylase, biotin carboxylase, biotin carboxyl carrier protein
VHTRWIETEFAGDIPPYAGSEGLAGADGSPAPRERITVEVQGKRLEVVLPGGLGRTGAATAQRPGRPGRARRSARSGASLADGDTLTSPMQGTIVKIVASEGERVSAGDTVVVLEAMKMEQPLTAHKDGVVTGLTVKIGQTVAAGDPLCQLKD